MGNIFDIQYNKNWKFEMVPPGISLPIPSDGNVVWIFSGVFQPVRTDGGFVPFWLVELESLEVQFQFPGMFWIACEPGSQP